MQQLRNARHQNPPGPQQQVPIGRARTSLVRPAHDRAPPNRRCQNGSRKCLFMCRDTNRQCQLCTHNESGYCWQHSLNPSMKMTNDAGEIVGNRQAGEELLAGDIAPIQRNLNILNDEVFISLCLRKIKDQCRHIQLPFFTDPHRVRVDASKNDPNLQDWLPFVCYVRRPYGDSQIHLVMTNFYSSDTPGVNITVWSPQFTILDCRNKRETGGDSYYLDRMSVLARELDVSIDDNFTQIFNCNIGNNSEYNFSPVVPLFSVEKQMWTAAINDGTAPFNLHSVYALNCICMVKHIVLEIQKYQRTRRSNRFRNNRERPRATELIPIMFSNFNRLLNNLGFELNAANNRYEFEPDLLRASRYVYNDRREKRSYRITITELNLQDFFRHEIFRRLNNRAGSGIIDYLENIIEWSTQVTSFFNIRTSRMPTAPKRVFRASLMRLTRTWHLICQSLSPLFSVFSYYQYMNGFENIGELDPRPDYLLVIEQSNRHLQQDLQERQRIMQELEPAQYIQRAPRLAAALNRIAVAASRRTIGELRRRRHRGDAAADRNTNKRPGVGKTNKTNKTKNTKKGKRTNTANKGKKTTNGKKTNKKPLVNFGKYGPATTSARANENDTTSSALQSPPIPILTQIEDIDLVDDNNFPNDRPPSNMSGERPPSNMSGESTIFGIPMDQLDETQPEDSDNEQDNRDAIYRQLEQEDPNFFPTMYLAQPPRPNV